MVSEQRRTDDRGRLGRRGWSLVAAAVLVLALVAWAVAAAVGGSSDPVASPSPSSDGSATPVTPTAVASATPEPTATDDPGVPSVNPTDPSDPVASDPPPRETLAPVPLDEAAEPADALEVELASLEAVEGIAEIAGEIAGPALRITVEATNRGTAALDTPAVIVNLYIGEDRRPANTIMQPGSRAFPPSIPAGGTASGVYLFTVPMEERDLILVEVDLAFGEPVVLFEGPVR
jgi:hypothetical protein